MDNIIGWKMFVYNIGKKSYESYFVYQVSRLILRPYPILFTIYKTLVLFIWASQVALVVKNLPGSAGDVKDLGSVPGLERSPGVGNGTHSSIFAWRIP